jgi:hypothetical protein
MILASFFFSHRALAFGIGRDGIGLKVMKIAQTDKQTHIARFIYKDLFSVRKCNIRKCKIRKCTSANIHPQM